MRPVVKPMSVGAANAEGILSDDTFDQIWQKSAPDYRASSLSPAGDYAAVVSGDAGRVTLYQISNRSVTPAWSEKIAGAGQAVVTAGARNVLTFTTWNPVKRQLNILKGSDGALLSTTTLDGAIWDVCVSPDGCFAGVVTGSHSLYLFTLGNQPVFHRWDLFGIGNSAAFTRNSLGIVAGTWDDSGVACYSRAGNAVWQFPEHDADRKALMDRLFEVHVADEGRYVLGLSYANIRQGDGTLYLFRTDGMGVPLWTRSLGPDTFYPRARITADGRFIAVTYLNLITRNSTSIQERRLIVLDDENNIVWQTGGLLFPPVLVALAPDGHRVTVSNGIKTLYHLNGQGHITASWTATGTIHDTQPSLDGNYLLTYTGDGTLTLLKLTRSH